MLGFNSIICGVDLSHGAGKIESVVGSRTPTGSFAYPLGYAYPSLRTPGVEKAFIRCACCQTEREWRGRGVTP